VVVPAAARVPGLSLDVAGVPLGEATWGTPFPVDPGRVTVRASAPGRVAWQSTVDASGEGAIVVVDVPALEAGGARPAQVAPTATTAPQQAPADAAPTSSLRRPLGLVLAGVGVAGMGVGVTLGLVVKSNHDDASCNESNRCDQPGLDARDDAVALGNVGTAVFIGGAALAVGGAVLFFTAPSGRAVTARLSASRATLNASF
jgi:hypothetical protein